MLAQLLQAVHPDQLVDAKKLRVNQWGNQIDYFTGEDTDWDHYDIAILGIEDYRDIQEEQPEVCAADLIRKELYQLFNWEDDFNVIDLGNIRIGATVRDTFAAVEAAVSELVENKVLPIVIGNTQEFTYQQYKAYEAWKLPVNIAVFDERIDLDNNPSRDVSQSYIYKILAHQPNFLGNYMQLGYQNYLVDPDHVETIQKMYFECHRLSYFLNDIRRIEPLVRNADMVSLDVSCIRFADAPGQHSNSPNGFSGHDVCRMARYAGMSDKVSSFGIYEYDTSKDIDGRTAYLLAQIIWHFVEGFYARKDENPEAFETDFLKYKVSLNDGKDEIVFLKSRRSARWWMKIPIVNDGKTTYKVVPCSEEEYDIACRKEIPDRWMHSFIKYSTKSWRSTDAK